jgi:hypothetical protein
MADRGLPAILRNSRDFQSLIDTGQISGLFSFSPIK